MRAAVLLPGLVALVACAADPAPRSLPTTPPPVTTAAPTPSSTSTPAREDASFVTPSGNIACELTVEHTECSIADRRWQPPAGSPRCGRQRVIVEIWDGAVRFGCGYTDAEASSFLLHYGRSLTVGSVTCVSARTGVTCRTRGGRGFTIGRAAYRVYG